MTGHLTEQQIAAVMAGEKMPAAAGHLETCAQCRQQVEEFQNVLGAFRTTVREMGDVRRVAVPAVEPGTRLWPILARACVVVLIVILSVVGYRFSSKTVLNKEAAAPTASVASVDSDAALLEHVKSDVSRSVPTGMDSLLGLTSEGTTQR